MPFALKNNIDIELLIDGRRNELFQKITSHVPSTPFGNDPNSPESIPDLDFKHFPSSDNGKPPFQSNISIDQSPATENVPSAQSLHFNNNLDDMQDVLGYFYFVQDSFLSDNGSERIFKVKHRSIDYYYYAFKFKDWVVCPAFLVSWFGLTKYACLKVVNDSSRYFYILLNSKFDNALSHILDKNSPFLGRYYFEVPVPSTKKIFYLSNENKDVKVFIDVSDETPPRDRAFLAELSKYRHNPFTELQLSGVDPSYYLIPIESLYHFRGRDCVPPSIKQYPAAIIHSCSESLSEISNFWRKDNIREGQEWGENVGKSLHSSFIETVYKREEYILEKFVSHIQRNFMECKSMKVKAYYCSMITVFQSSGYGKSKLMLKLGSRMPTFYSSLLQGKGYPYESYYLARLIKELDKIVFDGVYTGNSTDYCWMNNITTAVYIYILRILFVILKDSNNASLKKESFQIDDELEAHKFFGKFRSERIEIFKILFRGLEDICKSPSEIPFDGENTLNLKEIQIVQELSLNKFAIDFRPKEYLTNDLEGDVMALLDSLKIKDTDLPSIFVIDEYHGLWYKKTKNGKENYAWCFRDTVVKAKTPSEAYRLSPFNVFCRIFRMFSNTWERLMLIVTGKHKQASLLQPKRELDLPRLPTASHKIIENFSLLPTYNANSEIFQSINANMFPNDEGICNWVDFLKSDFRIVEYFKFGVHLIMRLLVIEIIVIILRKNLKIVKSSRLWRISSLVVKNIGKRAKLAFYIVCSTLPLEQISFPVVWTGKTWLKIT